MKEMKDEIKEDMNTNRKVDLEDIKEMVEEMMNANQAKTNADLKEMREEIKSGQAEMKSTVSASWYELEDVNNKTHNLRKELVDKIEKKRKITGGITSRHYI
jgi:hypothetical protein